MPAEGEEWPIVGRALGGAFVGGRPSRYMIELVPVPETAALVPVRGVRSSGAEQDEPPSPMTESHAGPPPERRTRSLAGWLVEVDEQHG